MFRCTHFDEDISWSWDSHMTIFGTPQPPLRTVINLCYFRQFAVWLPDLTGNARTTRNGLNREQIVLIRRRLFHSTDDWKSRSHSPHLKKPFSLKSFKKAVLIQLRRKSRSHSTNLKKPFSFNSVEKAVLIQLSEKSRLIQLIWKSRFSCKLLQNVVLIQFLWKSRSHSTHLKKSFSFNSFEAVFIQLMKKPSSFNSYKKAVLIQLIEKSH
jgi:pterin-4a-carbinolamine dehydratase